MTSHAELREIEACREIRAEAPGPGSGRPAPGASSCAAAACGPAPSGQDTQASNVERSAQGGLVAERGVLGQRTCLCLATCGLDPRVDVTQAWCVPCVRVCAAQARVAQTYRLNPSVSLAHGRGSPRLAPLPCSACLVSTADFSLLGFRPESLTAHLGQPGHPEWSAPQERMRAASLSDSEAEGPRRRDSLMLWFPE